MIQKTVPIYHYSSDYNLKTLCPNINLYKTKYIDYIDYLYTFPKDKEIINHYSLIENIDTKIAAFSSYLIYSILSNFLDTKSIVKKDIEDYYNTQMLSFLRTQNLLGHFKLKYLANAWNSLNKTIDLLLEDLSSYDSMLLNQDFFWSDSLDNYYHTVPYIGVKNDLVDALLVLPSNHNKYPLLNQPLDYLRIPSIVFTLKSLHTQGLKIDRLKILWLDTSDITKKFQYIIYRNIPYSYILDNTDILNFKNNTSLPYPNLQLCHSCPYLSSCNSKGILYSKSTNIPIKTLPEKLFEHKRALS